MNEKRNRLIIQRILVALDGSPHSQSALEAAVNLAGLLNAELIGVFVEDINLLRLAQLPFAHEIQAHTAVSEKLNMDRMKRQLRLQAQQAEENLAQLAQQHTVSYSFRIMRGPVSAELLAAALEADLLALGRISRSVSRKTRLGSTARTAVNQTTHPVLLMSPNVALDRPILLVYDGSAGANKALDVAAYLAQGNGRLQVLLWADNKQHATDYQHAITQTLQTENLKLEFRYLTPADSANLAYIMKLSGMGLMVLNDTDSRLPAATIHTLVEELDHPVLLVR
ncbi:MAG: universal stress protein [Chloroflexota bacterium]